MTKISVPVQGGMANLTELWRRAGSPDNKSPYDWLGGTARDLKTSMGLDDRDNLRDNLPHDAIVSLDFAELLAKKRLEADYAKGNTPSQRHCRTAGQITRDALQRAIGV